MRRTIVMVLLAAGALLGFASGATGMRSRARARHEAFERHVARLCVDAAREAAREAEGGSPPGPPPPFARARAPGW